MWMEKHFQLTMLCMCSALAEKVLSLLTLSVRLYINHFMFHRNAETWGPNANEFDPYRFIEGSPSYREIPVGGYRPFERGPRNCIGQVGKKAKHTVWVFLLRHM